MNMPSSPPLLEVRDVVKAYGGVRALNGLNLSVRQGEIHCILGPNGAGKSTFFKTIMGTERPTTGRVFYKGQDVTRLPAYARARRGLSVKFQNLRTFGDLSVLQNLYPALRRRFSPPEIPGKAEELLARVRLDVSPDRLVKHISHGQQQWLAIATAMASEPDLLLLDEPTAGLGPEETHLTAEIIRDLNAAKVTVVVIEHDMGFIRSLCGRTSVLHYGALFAQGTFEEMAADPRVQKIYLGTE
ncbi:ABC transporter ATP-binding protein [Pontibaca methylaminivorans]|uniref:Branched-chain amino acid transport system ATP-binding protein n=1 Tax=Pontibaca methylaminivorans TaxID=515897 RepID=A0A1R3WXA3_9RHOB|nr:ABC transporter ATP-binding protein [Pontibaca methylaminivorans]SIT82765.1 branched-chain amino acid transport system ATP-binding protein [Pontibaca methylaminivorans]